MPDNTVRYMLLVYSDESKMDEATEEMLNEVAAGHRAVMEEARRAGAFVAGEPLAATSTSTTVRVRDGQRVVVDGPFAETKEQLAGYYILDCRNLDEAISWAEKIPTACAGAVGSVEIRPMRYQ
jgi:hypothetical protein